MPSLTRLALCLLLWLPAAAYAQSPDAQTPPTDTAPSASQPPPFQDEIIPRQASAGVEEPDRLIPRILLGTTVGGVAGAAGSIAGLFVGLLIGDCHILDGCSSDVLALTPVVLGLWSASAFTVYGMGKLIDGRGKMLPTLLGGALGSGVGILVGSAADALYLAPLIAAVGAVIGFEFSHAGTEPEPEEDPFAAMGIQLTPVVSMTPTGGVFGGLVGRF